MPKHLIHLAVVWYGDTGQAPINKEQFQDLKRALKSFRLEKYDFNKGEQGRLLRDYKKGKVDIALKNSYGRGHEADVELYLERNGIPFLGSGSQATLSGTSKFLSKKLFESHGLPIAKHVFVDRKIWSGSPVSVLQRVTRKIGFPCIVKDVAGTDSRGISIVHDSRELKIVLEKAMRAGNAVIVEKYIVSAYETTCFVAERNGIPYAYEPVGIQTSGVLTAAQKDSGAIDFAVPAKLPFQTRRAIKKVSIQAHRALGCQMFSRSGLLVKGSRLYLLEVDVHPGFRKKSVTTKSVDYDGSTLDRLFMSLYRHYVRTPAFR